MNTNYTFFPCAGKGTRMGSLGKLLPKPLWPIFDTTLLELQATYANSLGFENFLINTHHLAPVIEDHLKRKNLEVKQFYEEALLGSGGCFHNLLANGINENVFIFNPDSFLLLSPQDWQNFLSMSSKSDQVLIAIPCEEDDLYNRLVTVEGALREIVPPGKGAPLWTYSGFGKINLKTINLRPGVSSFFDSVAKLDSGELNVFYPSGPFEFWDFGTIDLYKSNINKLLNNQDSFLWQFLSLKGYVSKDQLALTSYYSKSKNVINFTGREIGDSEPGIYISVSGNDDQNGQIVRVS